MKMNPFKGEEKNKFLIEVPTYGKTMTNEGVAEAIADEGVEYQRESILDILSRRDRMHRNAFGRGEGTQDENFYYGPFVTGRAEGSTAKFDPAKNRAHIKARPTRRLRKQLNATKINFIGLKNLTARIGKLFDFGSGKTDEVITPDDDVRISGVGMQIFPLDDPEMGVFFTNLETVEVYRVDRPLRENFSKTILARTPELADGTYEMKIVTRYSGNKKKPLKEPHTLIFHIQLTVGNAAKDKIENPENDGKEMISDDKK